MFNRGPSWHAGRTAAPVQNAGRLADGFGLGLGFGGLCGGWLWALRPEFSADLWSVLGRWIRDTPWFWLVSDGVILPAHNTFRDHDEEGLQDLLKPVSQVRILPGAQVRHGI